MEQQSEINGIAALLGQSQKASQHHGEIPHITLPDGYRIESIEHLLPTPSRIRGIFTTCDPDAFIRYVERAKVPGKSVIFLSGGEKPVAQAIIDFHGKDAQGISPGWCEHQVFLKGHTLETVQETLKDTRLHGVPVFAGTYEPTHTED
jgi:uncharacterized protein YfdQ (DUF2303 family)